MKGEGGLQIILKLIYFIRVTIYPTTFPHNTSGGHYLPIGGGGRLFTDNFPTHLFYKGHYLTSGPIPQ